jgi:hypothetical protein
LKFLSRLLDLLVGGIIFCITVPVGIALIIFGAITAVPIFGVAIMYDMFENLRWRYKGFLARQIDMTALNAEKTESGVKFDE